MKIEPLIELVVCGSAPAETLRSFQAALAQTSETNATTAQPRLIVCFACHWSDALLMQVGQHVQSRQAAAVVAVGDEMDAAATLALLKLGVWNVIGERHLPALAEAIRQCADRLAAVERSLDSPLVQKNLIGSSDTWRIFLRELIWVTSYSSAAVLLSGETGTGKELLARLIHTLDPRKDKGELVIVDCTTLGSELAGSELFGHEKGAFTSAHAARVGAAALANGGTLFLDEVGELPMAVQAQLLRLLQEGSYKTVGGSSWKHTTFRLICATHRDLRDAVAQGRFRQDLFFRISDWTAEVPPLRERVQDIPVIANHFLHEFGCAAEIDLGVTQQLQHHPFPGNVRELRQLMRQAAVKHCGNAQVGLGDLPLSWHTNAGQNNSAAPMTAMTPVGATKISVIDTTEPLTTSTSAIADWVQLGMGLREIARRAGDIAIQEALGLERYHVGRAARRLGITERAIQLRKAQRESPPSD